MLPGEQLLNRCPQCDRKLGGIRFGLGWGDVAVRIIDSVVSAGPVGISPDELFEKVYGGRPSGRGTLKSYIDQINFRLKKTRGLRITARGNDGRYHIRATQ